MMYFAVARDGHDGGVQITASHNPKEYNGIKMVRQEAFPLSGDAGIGDIRDMIAGGKLPRAGGDARARSRRANVVDDYVKHVHVVHRSAIIKPFNVVLDAGSGMAGHGRAEALRAPAVPDDDAVLRGGRHVPQPRSQSAHRREPPRHRRAGDRATRPTSASRGTATPTAVFFIDGSGEFIAGDFVTALLAEAFLLKHPGAKIVYDVRASYAVKDTAAKYGGTALMNRVGHAFFKQRMREEGAIFGGEVTGHYYFRDYFYADNGFIPALLILELMSRKGQTLRELLAPLREKYFISGEINTKLSDMSLIPAKLDGLSAKYTRRPGLHAGRHLGRVSATGTSTCAPRTPSRCCG